jgi:hypothetical protein
MNKIFLLAFTSILLVCCNKAQKDDEEFYKEQIEKLETTYD